MSKITKLGLGIIAFEGLEHVKNITYELRTLCDVIVICLQKYSYHGDKIEQVDIDEANKLKEYGFVDDIIWFEPKDKHTDEPVAGPRLIETDKRNFILDYLENNGCSHSLVIDSDEFYDHDDFENAKNFINTSETRVTYCQYINYYRDYRHLLVWPFLCYVPFITESCFRFKFKSPDFNKPSDPTRRYYIRDHNCTSFYIFPFDVVKMHHLSWIRKDISKKIKSWSAKNYFKDFDKLKEMMLERYNNYKDGQNAIIMFNVPHFQVVVDKLPMQYIHPHFILDEEDLLNS